MSAPIDPNHFTIDTDGNLMPQPWMQWRPVATTAAPPVSGSYAASTAYDSQLQSALTAVGASLENIYTHALDVVNEYAGIIGGFLGINLLGGLTGQQNPAGVFAGVKNDLLYSLTQEWTNNTPINQWVYGWITRGGIRMTVQARTQAYMVTLSGFVIGLSGAAPTLSVSSVMGCGATTGAGGQLATGPGYCIIEQRQNESGFYVAPEICGWSLVEPGQTYTAALQVRYASPYWETASIDGGNTETDTSYSDGGTRLDIFALPVL